jgi:hypothetical protein
MGKLKMGNLNRMSHNWEFIQDLLYLLPFTHVDRVVETYEEEILATLIVPEIVPAQCKWLNPQSENF